MIILIIIFLVYKILAPKKTDLSQSIPRPTSSSLDKPTGKKMVVSNVSVENIYNSELGTNSRGDILFSQSENYQIFYFSQEKQFLISIIGAPFDQKRILAEQNFLKILKINEKDACKLNTVVNTPSFANPKEAGINYKLSFCDK